jgi:hypothetical protein
MKYIYFLLFTLLFINFTSAQKSKNEYPFYRLRNDKMVYLNSGTVIRVYLNNIEDSLNKTFTSHNYVGYLMSLNDTTLTLKCFEEHIYFYSPIRSNYDDLHYKYPTRKDERRFDSIIGTLEDSILGVTKIINCSNIRQISYQPPIAKVYQITGMLAMGTIFYSPLFCINYSNWTFNSGLFWKIAGYTGIVGVPSIILTLIYLERNLFILPINKRIAN